MDPALDWQAIAISLLGALSAMLLWRLSRLRKAAPPLEVWVSSRAVYRQVHKVLVRDIMSKELVTLAPEDSAKRAWRRLQENKVKTLPVVENGVVVGVIALVDFLKHLGLAWHTLPEDLTNRANIVMDQDVATLMSKPARTVPADMPLAELVPMLSDTGLRHIPVVNAGGKLVGIVTQSDLIAGLTHMLSQPPSE
ncbi:MAG TPA: CBS domain-containing protein [Rhodocyclaceae bacterium]|nr:CBS domain-containing protein [Rhodocyclaceae bacterium]